MRQLRCRLASALRGFAFGWKNPYDFDWWYPLNAFKWRLKRLERALDRDPWHEGSADCAQDIRRFLILLDDFENAIDRVPRTPFVERWFDQWRPRIEMTDEERAELRAWSDAMTQFEENTWNEAFNLLRDRLRWWWC